MAASGFTPIQLYYSTTTTNVPLVGNLAAGELAINAADGKLYYKNTATNTVKLLADGSTATGNLPGGSAGTVVYQSGVGVTAYLPIAAAGYVLTSNGTIPTYVAASSLTVGAAATATFATTAGSATSATTATTATNLANGVANQLAYQASAGATSFVNAPVTTGTVLGWTGTNFAWVAAPAATTAASLAGGAQYQVPFQSGISSTTFSANFTFDSSTNTLTVPNVVGSTLVSGTAVTATNAVTGNTHVSTKNIAPSSNTGAFNYGTLSYSDTNIFEANQTSVNSYAQKIMQNTNSGAAASVDFIVSNDLGSSTTYYGDFGMNSSGFTGTGSFQLPNAVYLYSASSDLVIGTQTSNSLHFTTNNNAADSITINPTSAVAFNGNYGTVGQVLYSAGTTAAPTWGAAPITAPSRLYFFGQF